MNALAGIRFPQLSFNYLVTAKHCADKIKDRKAYLRANSVKGESAIIEVKAGEMKWFHHPTDTAADVAITPLGASQKIIDYLPLPIPMLLREQTRIEKGIGIGDEIFITGLFTYHAGKSKNIPIVRTGNIAMTPDEKIPVKNFGEMDAYLIESRSIGGLSGSPVFAISYSPEKTEMHLLGLIHGHWDCDPESIVDEVSEDSGIKARLNMGIAIVTPASKILDIINCAELIEMRDREIKEIESKNSPVPD